VGLLFAPQINFLSIYSTPELALLVGNIFSYFASPKLKLLLTLKEKIQLAPDEWDFIFIPDEKLKFTAGQYMEWTLPNDHVDNRGNRRYFTLASAPTEEHVRIGVKLYENSSTFKKKLLQLNPGEKVLAANLSGEFTLNRDPDGKYVFIAGGIGVTPYRSIVKNLIDTNQKRDIILLYSDRTEQQLVYRDVFSEAERKFGMRKVYVLSDRENVPSGWGGKVGHIDGPMIAESVPDFKQRYFYISGSHAVVVTIEKVLADLGVPRSQIKTDFFPGFV
jgi:ferredoxin-NADP reductase